MFDKKTKFVTCGNYIIRDNESRIYKEEIAMQNI